MRHCTHCNVREDKVDQGLTPFPLDIEASDTVDALLCFDCAMDMMPGVEKVGHNQWQFTEGTH